MYQNFSPLRCALASMFVTISFYIEIFVQGNLMLDRNTIVCLFVRLSVYYVARTRIVTYVRTQTEFALNYLICSCIFFVCVLFWYTLARLASNPITQLFAAFLILWAGVICSKVLTIHVCVYVDIFLVHTYTYRHAHLCRCPSSRTLS